ncbi:hypothetical protein M432DRAFT_541622, partial [Thermoascus aurantiacus ATCC 26904]
WPPDKIPEDVFLYIAEFLSREDIGRMRLVNHEFSAKLAGAMFKSVVVPFGPGMYSLSQNIPISETGSETLSIGPFERYGDRIYKFGISFELDEESLIDPPQKQTMKTMTATWGSYSWPKAEYQRYYQLQVIEDTADELRRMKKAFESMKNVTELGLTLNSGHGWLNGPDVSDYSRHFGEKPMVFGKSYPNPDIKKEQEWNSHFLLAQTKSILGKQSKESFSDLTPEDLERKQDSFLKEGKIYSYDSFRATNRYPSRFLKDGIIPPSPRLGDTQHREAEKFTNRKLGNRKLYPRSLMKSQIEWLREAAWAQKSFLTTYVVSVIGCSDALRNVHSLHLSCIPSGLLEDIARADFLEALPQLSHLTLMVSPDWRETWNSADGRLEFVDPTLASEKFMRILDSTVNSVPKIKSLTIGFVGGGEDGSGMFSRNQLIMPAPLTTISGCRAFCRGVTKDKVIVFPNVTKLRFKNCWFSPDLLDTFLACSRRTELEELIMDSCSLTAAPYPASWRECFFRKPDVMFPVHAAANLEQYVRPGTWTDLINKHTPGPTIAERDLGYVPGLGKAQPKYLERWEFISCGYVMLYPGHRPAKIPFAQWNLVLPDMGGLDPGLHSRWKKLRHFMLDDSQYPFLGTIVQCIGEDEEFILQNCFNMRLGWGDDLRRWRTVDDGFYEGGTGRFSGVLLRLDSDGPVE